jgi:hypothetical protein
MYRNLGQHIRERIQTCHPKGKTYRDAQLGEFVHSVVVEQLPEHSLVGVNPYGSAEKVKLLLNSSHLEPHVVRLLRHRGDDDSE